MNVLPSELSNKEIRDREDDTMKLSWLTLTRIVHTICEIFQCDA